MIVNPSSFLIFKFNGSPNNSPSKLLIFTSSLSNSTLPFKSEIGGISNCGFSSVLPKNSYVPLKGMLSRSSKPTFKTNFSSPSPLPSISSKTPFIFSLIGLLLIAKIMFSAELSKIVSIFKTTSSAVNGVIDPLKTFTWLLSNSPFWLVINTSPPFTLTSASNFSISGQSSPYSIKLFFIELWTLKKPLVKSGLLFLSI